MDEKIITIINEPDGMPGYVSRMISEATELNIKINALNQVVSHGAAGIADQDGDIEINSNDYDWMVAQLQAMVAYAHALDTRIRLAGYDLTIIENPTVPV